jgi:hypothetical protein
MYLREVEFVPVRCKRPTTKVLALHGRERQDYWLDVELNWVLLDLTFLVAYLTRQSVSEVVHRRTVARLINDESGKALQGSSRELKKFVSRLVWRD